jgi:hypothetical protein
LGGGGVISAATIVGIGICQAANDVWAHDGRGGKGVGRSCATKAIEVGVTTAVIVKGFAATLKLCCTWVAAL